MISISALVESAAAAEASVKSVRPARKTLRRPSRSPSAAAGSSSTAKVRVYAFTVHSRPSSPACRCSRMDGSAVVTTRLSSATMNAATDVTMIVATALVAGPGPTLQDIGESHRTFSF